MEFFRLTKTIPFMRYAPFFNVLSFLLFFLSVLTLSLHGLNFSTEFTGGTIVEVSYAQPANLSAIRLALEKRGLNHVLVQNYGSSRDILFRLSTEDVAHLGLFQNGHLNLSDFSRSVLMPGGENPVVKRSDFVGPQVGSELARNGVIALILVCLGIVVYLAIRFEWRFAVSAIVANLHDVIIILGFFSFFHWEFSLSVLAAVLAVLGYSVNESVVIFDRIRESFIHQRQLDTPSILDYAITSTLSRTVITHLCTQLMVTSMLFFGGESLHNFALALTIGICFSIYSSVLVSSPLLMWFRVSKEQFLVKKKGNDDRNDPNAGAVV